MRLFALLTVLAFIAPAPVLLAQTDQGTITGVVQDPTGAAIANANVTLSNVDTGLVLKSTADGGGVYVFSPIKIGNYKVTAGAPGFGTTTETNLQLSIQQRLNVVITLKPGAAVETVNVTTETPLMQTQEGSVGQTMDTRTINSVPLNGRNWVFIAQLAAGVVPPITQWKNRGPDDATREESAISNSSRRVSDVPSPSSGSLPRARRAASSLPGLRTGASSSSWR